MLANTRFFHALASAARLFSCRRPGLRVAVLLAFTGPLFANRARVDTERVELNFDATGFGRFDYDLSLSPPHDLTDVSFVVIEPFTWHAIVEGGWATMELSVELLDGGGQTLATTVVAWNRLWWDGAGVTTVFRAAIPVLADGHAEHIRFVVNQMSESATNALSRFAGQLASNVARVHFVHGDFDGDGPNTTRPIHPVQTRVDGVGSSPWTIGTFDPPVTSEHLRLIFHSMRPYFVEFEDGGYATEVQLQLDDGSLLQLDDAFSPADGRLISPGGCKYNFLYIEDNSRLAGREITGWRWRVRHDGPGWVEVSSGGALDLFFAYDLAMPHFRRGDCNDDGAIDIADASCILNWLFLGGASPRCVAVTNANGDENADISDATYLLNHLFLGGPPPAAPFPDCGTSDLAGDGTLGCAETPEHCQ